MTGPDAPRTPAAPASAQAPTPGPAAAPAGFTALMEEVTAGAEHFDHRRHVHLAWLAVRRHGRAAALTLVADGIRATATRAGAPQRFHVTMTRAWVELVARHASDDEDFTAFADRHPDLLDKGLLARHYRPGTLADERARTGWVEPDLKPFDDQPS
ncbi:hypothetical protein AB0C76_17930 [Kitasatospora sp. NPDC048722]|uniref:hypothetical protein n=1 Tax=Kitasatospora sp. NPDC048722 TaxID=3155639 RepID=UPI0033D3F3E2